MNTRIALVGFLLFACLFACRPTAPAREARPVPQVSLAGLPETIRRVQAHAEGRLALPVSAATFECVEVTDVAETFVCVFNGARFMNAALNRASEYVELERRVLTDQEHIDNGKNALVEGHDLKGADLRAFDAAWRAARPSFAPVEREEWREALAFEDAFWDGFVRPRLGESPDLVLLAVATGTDIEGTLSHEILHAQYFRSAEHRRLVAEYWSTVPEADRKRAKELLRENYDVEDAALLVNEFQAYVLMHRAEEFELATLAKTHREPLRARLRAAGIEPLQVRLPAE